MSKTHWKKLMNPDYIGAYALQPGEEIVVTIQRVQCEKVTGTGGKKEECSVAHLVGQKPLILNATNSKTIASLYGPYIEDWAGKQIRLYASTTPLGGQIVECLRIRPIVPSDIQKSKTILTDSRLAEAVAAVKDGRKDVAFFKDMFDLTQAQIDTLESVSC